MAAAVDFAQQRESLLQAIEQDQEEVRVAVHELTDAAHASVSLTQHIAKYPLTVAIGAFAVGLWLGSRRARARAPQPGGNDNEQ